MPFPYARLPIHPAQWARNGQYPDALLETEIAQAATRQALFRGKEVFRYFSHDLQAGGSTAERIRWRFAFRSSPYMNAIYAVAWMGQAQLENASLDPYARLRIETGAPATLGDAEFHFGATTSASATPDTLSPIGGWLYESGTTTIATLAADTEYYGTVSDFQSSRIIGISVFEVAHNPTAPFHLGAAVGGPILDSHREELVLGARKLWKQGGSHLMNWSTDTAAAPKTRSSATHANIIDASTTASASSAGFTLDLRNRSTVRRGTNVPVVLKVYAGMSAGNGTVRLMDSNNDEHASIAISGTAAWSSASLVLPATLEKYDIQFAGDGVNTISLYSVSAYSYASGT